MIMRVIVAAMVAATPAACWAQSKNYPLPPLQFAGVEAFLDAVDVDRSIGEVVDGIWQPATAALVSANPARADAARRFAQARRDSERAAYRPLIAFQLDRATIQILNPTARRALAAILDGVMAKSVTPAAGEARRTALAARADAVKKAAFAPTNATLVAITRLARTPDGMALQALNRRGLYSCLPRSDGRGTTVKTLRPECAALLATPALARLRRQPLGSALIDYSSAVQVIALGTIAMAHDAGLSFQQLLSSDAVAAAGLTMPTPLERPL